MPNIDYLTKLVGTSITGRFKRTKQGIEADIRTLNLEYEPEEREQKRDELTKSSYDFSLNILHFDKSNGLFIASAKDMFGTSGVIGRFGEHKEDERAGSIVFQKSYSRERDIYNGSGNNFETDFHMSLRQIFYVGSHWLTSENIFNAEGKFSCQDTRYEITGGTWEMSAKLSE